MSSMKDILNKLALVESLDKDQKKANQLSAEFKPKTTKVLGAKKDPENPLAGKLVGTNEDTVAEDILAQVKQGLADYLKGLDNKPADSHIFSAPKDLAIIEPVKTDRDLIQKKDPIKHAVAVVNAGPVKTIQIDDMTECGIYGDEDAGFEIRRGDKILPTKFKALDHAIAAADVFAARRRQQNSNPDYREEK